MVFTSDPTSTTSPAISWPGIRGKVLMRPGVAIMITTVRPAPHTRTLISASLGPGFGLGTSLSFSGAPNCSSTIARISSSSAILEPVVVEQPRFFRRPPAVGLDQRVAVGPEPLVGPAHAVAGQQCVVIRFRRQPAYGVNERRKLHGIHKEESVRIGADEFIHKRHVIFVGQ